jgi:hypothetical protein
MAELKPKTLFIFLFFAIEYFYPYTSSTISISAVLIPSDSPYFPSTAISPFFYAFLDSPAAFFIYSATKNSFSESSIL